MKTGNGIMAAFTILTALSIGIFLFTGTANAQKSKNKKPNIVVISGDDTGRSNISAYSHGLMGYQTPNIDRLAIENGRII